MRGIAFYFLCAAIIAVLIGMAWGIQMSAAGDHNLSGAHAHLNLVGWVTLSIFAFYYHVVPDAQAGWLPKLHLACALGGVLLLVPGIVMAIRGQDMTLAKLGSALSLLSMILFLIVVLRQGRHSPQPA
ncbi:MAG: hypothetical protein LPK02_03900 [Rhodobacterales bacterium]|nr:hypothetical protein [Rhodobacterales bacterium]MDX5412169.1 hypothetical protein [Rhodobacterales bacterium]